MKRYRFPRKLKKAIKAAMYSFAPVHREAYRRWQRRDPDLKHIRGELSAQRRWRDPFA